MKSYTLEQLAEITKSEFIGDADFTVTGVDELATAGPGDVSFLSNLKYRELMKKTLAGIVCVDRSTPLVEGKNYLLSEKPSYTFQQITELLAHNATRSGFIGIHPTAVIHQSAKIGKNVEIGPFVVIDRDVVIGDECKIYAHVSIGPETEVGEGCTFHPNVVIREGCKIGNRVILQPGAVIGGCGFGYITNEKGKHLKISHYGNVILEDEVEIGSNTTVDRGRFKATIIAKGTKVDNLVTIAHNASIGRDNLIVAQTGISGSSKTGKNVIMAGQSALVGHIELGDGVIVLARGAASKSILKPGVYGGAPAVPVNEWRRHSIHLKKLGEYADRLKALEKNSPTPVEEETPC